MEGVVWLSICIAVQYISLIASLISFGLHFYRFRVKEGGTRTPFQLEIVILLSLCSSLFHGFYVTGIMLEEFVYPGQYNDLLLMLDMQFTDMSISCACIIGVFYLGSILLPFAGEGHYLLRRIFGSLPTLRFLVSFVVLSTVATAIYKPGYFWPTFYISTLSYITLFFLIVGLIKIIAPVKRSKMHAETRRSLNRILVSWREIWGTPCVSQDSERFHFSFLLCTKFNLSQSIQRSYWLTRWFWETREIQYDPS